MNTALLTLASFGLIVPAMTRYSASAALSISRETAVVLFVVYLASLVAIFTNRKPVIGKEAVKANLEEKARRPDEVEEVPEAGLSRNKALVILAVVTVTLAIMSEILTRAIEPASQSLHLSPIFTGVFLLALVGNAAELFNAIRFARKDQMDLCIGITVGASVQVGLLVAPVLVFVGMITGQPMDLVFSPLELVAIVLAVYVDPEPDLRRRVELAGRLDLDWRLLPLRHRVPAPPRDGSARPAGHGPGGRGPPVIGSGRHRTNAGGNPRPLSRGASC